MDLIELGARVKFMNVIESAQGLIYRELAVYYAARSSVISSMYFTKSIEKLNASLTRNPTKVENLLLISEALWYFNFVKIIVKFQLGVLVSHYWK